MGSDGEDRGEDDDDGRGAGAGGAEQVGEEASLNMHHHDRMAVAFLGFLWLDCVDNLFWTS